MSMPHWPAGEKHRNNPGLGITTQRVRAKLTRVESDAGHPLSDEPSELASGHPSRGICGGRETQKKLARLLPCRPQIFVDRLPRLIGQLEPHRPTGLLLPDGCAIECIPIGCHIITRTATTSQPRSLLSQISFDALHLQLGPNRPNMARPRADEPSLIPWGPVNGCLGSRCMIVFHGLLG
jgi:hypothetical protein